LPSKQWFVAVDKKIEKLGGKSLKEKALEMAKNKQIEFIPFRFTKRYTDWMENLHDWCISRQIWFGHDIPVWYKGEDIFVGLEKPEGEGWIQDPDTLDTWFSSGMWTFSTLGWPDNFKNGIKSGDLEKFHPTQVLETGYEIITLWVSRMIMMSLFAVGEIPFEKVYLHGMVLDKFGKKMSKSKGNGIDPLDMIKKFGTDAVRLSLLTGSTPGNDLRVSEEKIESCRNFVTKLWNIFRYCVASDEKFKLVEKISSQDLKSLSDKWIVSRMNRIIQEVSSDLENFKFSMAGEKLQNFTWNDLADWYVEIHKLEKNSLVLGYVLDKVLKLWHPFMPFATESVFQHLKENEILMSAKWPEAESNLENEEAEKEFVGLQEAITKIRNLRSSYHIEPAKIINAFGEKIENVEIIEKLARVKISSEKATGKAVKISSGNVKMELDLSGLFDAEKEKSRLEKEIDNLKKAIFRTESLLANEKFIASAPEEIVAENKMRLEEYRKKLAQQEELINNL
jgi:valyl-tRNA synthetase